MQLVATATWVPAGMVTPFENVKFLITFRLIITVVSYDVGNLV